jgi:hypothetical protein
MLVTIVDYLAKYEEFKKLFKKEKEALALS